MGWECHTPDSPWGHGGRSLAWDGAFRAAVAANLNVQPSRPGFVLVRAAIRSPGCSGIHPCQGVGRNASGTGGAGAMNAGARRGGGPLLLGCAGPDSVRSRRDPALTLRSIAPVRLWVRVDPGRHGSGTGCEVLLHRCGHPAEPIRSRPLAGPVKRPFAAASDPSSGLELLPVLQTRALGLVLARTPGHARGCRPYPMARAMTSWSGAGRRLPWMVGWRHAWMAGWSMDGAIGPWMGP